MFEARFQLQKNQTTIRREIIAGLTTFAAMAYILAVNPSILAQAGMEKGALIAATALASALMTLVMALATNYPIALAPGMGLNAFFAFTLCLGARIPWEAALGLVFYGGVLFFILSVTGIRRQIIESIPHEMKLAITCGIGLFIAFIGLKGGGVVVANSATFVALGNFGQPAPMLVLGGVILAAVLVWRKIPGAIILTIAVLTAIGLFLPAPGGGQLTSLPKQILDFPPSLAPSFLKLDLTYLWTHWRTCLPLLLALLFVDLFDNMGTLIAVCQRAGLLDTAGNLPRLGRALAADAVAAMVGSTLGTSTVTSYIESAAGVEAGGRTGLTAVVTAICFLLALFFNPLIAIIPAAATAPALVIVGVFMMQSVVELDLKDFSKAVPAVVTMLAMPLTFSIAEGISLGFVVYVGLNLLIGRAATIRPLAYVLAILFLLHLIFR